MSRYVRCAAITLCVSWAVSGIGGLSASQATVEFGRLFLEYRTGDADRAVKVFAAWADERVEREAKLPGHSDVGSKTALALFQLESAERNWASPTMAGAAHQKLGWALLKDVCAGGNAIADLSLRRFCRDSYRIVLTEPQGIAAEITEIEGRFGEDALIQLSIGIHYQYWMPRVGGGGFRYHESGKAGEAPVFGTSKGQFGPEAFLAESAFRKALRLDPQVAEARVRLGRLLWMFDRNEEAERELLEARREASREADTATNYLAGLFLGQLYEAQRRNDAALAAYSDAIRIYPGGQSGRVAWARLLVTGGRESDALRTLRSVLSPLSLEERGADPWALYPLGKLAWQRPEAWQALRRLVRQ